MSDVQEIPGFVVVVDCVVKEFAVHIKQPFDENAADWQDFMDKVKSFKGAEYQLGIYLIKFEPNKYKHDESGLCDHSLEIIRDGCTLADMFFVGEFPKVIMNSPVYVKVHNLNSAVITATKTYIQIIIFPT